MQCLEANALIILTVECAGAGQEGFFCPDRRHNVKFRRIKAASQLHSLLLLLLDGCKQCFSSGAVQLFISLHGWGKGCLLQWLPSIGIS